MTTGCSTSGRVPQRYVQDSGVRLRRTGPAASCRVRRRHAERTTCGATTSSAGSSLPPYRRLRSLPALPGLAPPGDGWIIQPRRDGTTLRKLIAKQTRGEYYRPCWVPDAVAQRAAVRCACPFVVSFLTLGRADTIAVPTVGGRYTRALGSAHLEPPKVGGNRYAPSAMRSLCITPASPFRPVAGQPVWTDPRPATTPTRTSSTGQPGDAYPPVRAVQVDCTFSSDRKDQERLTKPSRGREGAGISSLPPWFC
jgi:hypothetical protein